MVGIKWLGALAGAACLVGACSSAGELGDGAQTTSDELVAGCAPAAAASEPICAALPGGDPALANRLAPEIAAQLDAMTKGLRVECDGVTNTARLSGSPALAPAFGANEIAAPIGPDGSFSFSIPVQVTTVERGTLDSILHLEGLAFSATSAASMRNSLQMSLGFATSGLGNVGVACGFGAPLACGASAPAPSATPPGGAAQRTPSPAAAPAAGTEPRSAGTTTPLTTADPAALRTKPATCAESLRVSRLFCQGAHAGAIRAPARAAIQAELAALGPDLRVTIVRRDRKTTVGVDGGRAEARFVRAFGQRRLTAPLGENGVARLSSPVHLQRTTYDGTTFTPKVDLAIRIDRSKLRWVPAGIDQQVAIAESPDAIVVAGTFALQPPSGGRPACAALLGTSSDCGPQNLGMRVFNGPFVGTGPSGVVGLHVPTRVIPRRVRPLGIQPLRSMLRGVRHIRPASAAGGMRVAPRAVRPPTRRALRQMSPRATVRHPQRARIHVKKPAAHE